MEIPCFHSHLVNVIPVFLTADNAENKRWQKSGWCKNVYMCVFESATQIPINAYLKTLVDFKNRTMKMIYRKVVCIQWFEIGGTLISIQIQI